MNELFEQNAAAAATAIDAKEIEGTVYHLGNLIPLLERRSLEKGTDEIEAEEIEMWSRLEEAFNEGKFDVAYIYALNIKRSIRLQNG